jgi:hypothetical protein
LKPSTEDVVSNTCRTVGYSHILAEWESAERCWPPALQTLNVTRNVPLAAGDRLSDTGDNIDRVSAIRAMNILAFMTSILWLFYKPGKL